MEKQSRKKEICGFINFEVTIEKVPWKAIRDHISASKGL